jgi:hypothetical protein
LADNASPLEIFLWYSISPIFCSAGQNFSAGLHINLK